MYGKSNMETCITKCKIDSQQEYGSGNSNRGSVFNLEGWDGEEDRDREVQEGGIDVYL